MAWLANDKRTITKIRGNALNMNFLKISIINKG